MTETAKPLIILLHGITQGQRHMQPMAMLFSQAGYPTAIIDYPWRNVRFESIIMQTASKIRARLNTLSEGLNPEALGQQSARYVIFAHSMGALVTRGMLDHAAIPAPESIVLSGPPNHGSESADALRKFPPFHWIYGNLGVELGTKDDAMFRKLSQAAPKDIPLGVIAANRSKWPLIRYLLPRPNDGKVSLASTHLEGETDHIVLPLSHDNMFKHRDVAACAIKFFENHSFERRYAQA